MWKTKGGEPWKSRANLLIQIYNYIVRQFCIGYVI